MAGFLDLAAWGTFGACVQGLAQGMRHKPLNYKPAGYVASAALFVGVGYLLDGVRETQKDYLDRRIAVLAQERAQRGVTFSRLQ